MNKMYVEVTNEMFDRIYQSGGILSRLYGTEYDTSFETYDPAIEYGHMIFSSRKEAERYHGMTLRKGAVTT